MSYVRKQLIGILVAVVAASGLWSLIPSDWHERPAAMISDLTIRLLTEILNSA